MTDDSAETPESSCAKARVSASPTYRQVHPRFLVDGQLQRDVVVPSSSDDHQLSLACGDKVTAEEAMSIHTSRLGPNGESLKSVGSVPIDLQIVDLAVRNLSYDGVPVALALVDDGECADRPDEHCSLDYRGNDRPARKLLYQFVHERVLEAIADGWPHGPSD